MSVLFMDSFNAETTDATAILRYDETATFQYVSTGHPRTGTYGGHHRGNNQNTNSRTIKIVTTSTALIAGLAQWDIPQSPCGIYFYDGATEQCHLESNGSGALVLKRGDGTTLVTTSNVMIASQHNYVEVEVTFHNTAGAYEIVVNGTSAASATNVNTRNSANNQATRVGIVNNSASGEFYFADFYVCDTVGSAPWNTFLSGKNPNNLPKIGTKAINGAGNSTLWTPDTGSNYARVNETAMDSDTSYVADTTIGDIDLYALASSGLTTNPILGVQTTVWTKLDSAGSRGICIEYRSGGANYDGATITEAQTASYKPHSEIKTLDPATSAQWTSANLDALQVGIKVVS